MQAYLAKWLGLGLACVTAFLACGESGVVGGKCRSGLIFCNGHCVDPETDARHCGACNNQCDDGVACEDGTCASGGADSGGTGGAGTGGNAGEAGAPGTSSGGMAATGGTVGTGGSTGTGGSQGATGGSGGTPTGSGGSSNGTGGSSTGGSGGSGPSCTGALDVPEQCGDCDTVCGGGAPLCAPADAGGYECVTSCVSPLATCGGQCVDLDTNPRHCGSCGTVCASGVCIDGDCVGATAGHIVYACMNYQQTFAQAAQITVLGNAVFLLNREPAQVLAYSDHARNAVVNAVDRAIGWAGDAIGRTAEITREADLSVIEDTLTLADYDVFLVYDQSQAPGGELAAAGAQLAAVLDDFTRAGGVVLMLSSGTGTAEMGEFSSSAGLLDVGAESDWTGELVYNQASGDAIGLGVITPFTTLPLSCTFATSESPSGNTVFVVTDTNPSDGVGEPIVIHKTVSP